MPRYCDIVGDYTQQKIENLYHVVSWKDNIMFVLEGQTRTVKFMLRIQNNQSKPREDALASLRKESYNGMVTLKRIELDYYSNI